MKNTKIIAALLVIVTVLSAAFPAYAEGDKEEVIISQLDLADDPAAAIERVLKKVKDLDDYELTVIVPEGTYVMNSGLHIYSNTTLIFKGNTKLIRNFAEGSMLKAGTQNDVNEGYNGYKNITVIGGEWDNSYTSTTCCIRFAHCKNVLLKDMFVKNVYDSHHMEIGAADTLTVDNVTFTGYKRYKNTSGEALQIDPVHSEKHFKAYQLLDDTPCKNITVKNCKFTNVFSGVGTRAGVTGSYFTNIKIINNSFSNIADKAILAFNYANSQISGNVINGATVGIFFEEYPQTHLTSKLYMPFDSSKGTNIRTNINTKIFNNTINVVKKSGYTPSCGIGIYGGVMSSATANNTGLKSGSYLVNNISVTNNKITLKSAASRGLEFEYVNSSTVTANTVNGRVKANSGINGITFYRCKKNKVSKNIVKGKVQYGIVLGSSSNTSAFNKNSISGSQQCGIAVTGGSKLVIDTSNHFGKNGTVGAYITDDAIKKPAIKGKLKVARKKNRNVVKWEKCETASGYFVYRKTSKNGAYTRVATIKNRNKTVFAQNTKTKCYYLVAPYRAYKGSVIIGEKVSR